MCNLIPTKTMNRSRQISIWNIPEHQLCTVIGTCLDTKQMRKLRPRLRKAAINIKVDTDYELHAACVAICRTKNPLSKSINKTFNQRYSPFIQTIRSVKDDDSIRQIWYAFDHNDLRALTGNYWAILINRHVSEKFKNLIHGEIHMISHISGQANKATLHTANVEAEQQEFNLRKKDRTILRKSQQLEQLRRVVSCLENQIIHLNSGLTAEKKRRHAENTQPYVYEQIIDSQMRNMDKLQTKVDKQAVQIEDLKQILNNGKNQIREQDSDTKKNNPSPEVSSDLCGKKILYVGGYARHRNKFQRLAEKIRRRRPD